MSKIDEIRSAMVAAMKAGEKEKKETLSMLLAALKNKQIDKHADLTEEEEIQVIMKAIIEGVLSELGIENPTGKDKGNIMKHLMPKVKGKADGKLVNDLVSTYFK